jgi:hypothetical protein
MLRYHLSVIFIFAACFANAQPAQVVRRDFFVPEGNGIRIFVRQVAAKHGPRSAPAVLLIHGARVPGIASFDLQVPGGSLAADLATRGLAVYVMDVRGYGASTRPKEMEEPAEGGAALLRSNEAARNMGAAVDWISRAPPSSDSGAVGLGYGRTVGGILCEFVSRQGQGFPLMGHGSDMEDRDHPGHFNSSACGSYRLNEEKSLFGVWDRSIPIENKNEWRDPAVARA